VICPYCMKEAEPTGEWRGVPVHLCEESPLHTLTAVPTDPDAVPQVHDLIGGLEFERVIRTRQLRALIDQMEELLHAAHLQLDAYRLELQKLEEQG